MAERRFGVFIIGEGRLGKGTYDAISSQEGLRVTGVMSAKADLIRETARQDGIGSFGYNKRDDSQFPELLKQAGTDLVVLADTRAKIPQPILDAGSLGFAIEPHNSLLSEFIGQSAANWPIVLGRSRSGYSIIRVGEEIDGGDIAEQGIVPIGTNDTAASYYIREIVPREVEATARLVRILAAGEIVNFAPQWAFPFPRTPGFERKFEKRDGFVDFSGTAEELHDLIRGSDPNPAASAQINGIPVDLFGSRIGEPVDGRPGTIVRISENRAALAAGDGIEVTIQRMRLSGTDEKIPAHLFLNQQGLNVGDKFSTIEV